MDAFRKLTGDQGFLGKIANYIPGFGGYVERETRRTADKLEREYLAGQLSILKQRLGEITLSATNSMKLELLSPLDDGAKKLEKVTDRVRFADYGYAGFFDAVKINEGELEKIYNFDLSLIEYIQAIGEWISTVENSLNDEEESKETLKKIKQLIKAINDMDIKFNDREQVIMEVKN